jgi:hypothetical protein
MKYRLPYVLLLIGTLGFLLYPRLLPSSAPDALRGDFAVGLVYGISIGLEILALLMLKARRPMC